MITSFFAHLKRTYDEWMNAKGPRLGAALAFYSVLSVGPVLVIALAAGELFWKKDVLTGHLNYEMSNLIGKDGTEIISTIVEHSQQHNQGLLATLISIVILFIGASGVFSELQDALNTIWQVPPKAKQPLFHIITDRFLSFAMVLGTGFVLLVSLIITTVLNITTEHLNGMFSDLPYIMMGVNWLVSVAITAALFGLIFKTVPDAPIRWKDVRAGAILTALLFDVGKILISFYIGHSAMSTTYGAAGSLVIFIVWVYYAAQILYFGAAFTKVQVEMNQPPTLH